MTPLSPRLTWYALVLCLFILVVSSVPWQKAVALQLYQWKVLPQPERFTELYFTKPTELVHLRKGRPQTLLFTVHNLEHQTISYTYHVFVYDLSMQKQPVERGYLNLKHDELRRIAKQVNVPATKQSVAIEIRLEYQGIPFGKDKSEPEVQAISYWIK